MPDQQQMQEYVHGVLKRLEKKPDSLSRTEKRLGIKLKEAQDAAGRVNEEISQLRQQLQQARQRLEEMGHHHIELTSKAAGFAESLITLEFGDEIDAEAEKQKSKGNGAKDPSKKKKKKTGVKRASRKSQPAAKETS